MASEQLLRRRFHGMLLALVATTALLDALWLTHALGSRVEAFAPYRPERFGVTPVTTGS